MSFGGRGGARVGGSGRVKVGVKEGRARVRARARVTIRVRIRIGVGVGVGYLRGQVEPQAFHSGAELLLGDLT